MFKVDLTEKEIQHITGALVVATQLAVDCLETYANEPFVEKIKLDIIQYRELCDKLVEVVSKPVETSMLYLPSKELVTPDTMNEINKGNKLII